jgi:hypothetical protein
MKQAEAQADADVDLAQTGLAQAQQAWTDAQNYVATQLRNDYLGSRYLRRGLSTGAALIAGPFAWGAAAGVRTASPTDFAWLTSPSYWNQELNDALPAAQAQIDQMGRAAVDAWQARLADATRRQAELFDARHAAELKLVTIRADHPDTTFPDCDCA